jgi:hypothetical protein
MIIAVPTGIKIFSWLSKSFSKTCMTKNKQNFNTLKLMYNYMPFKFFLFSRSLLRYPSVPTLIRYQLKRCRGSEGYVGVQKFLTYRYALMNFILRLGRLLNAISKIDNSLYLKTLIISLNTSAPLLTLGLAINYKRASETKAQEKVYFSLVPHPTTPKPNRSLVKYGEEGTLSSTVG